MRATAEALVSGCLIRCLIKGKDVSNWFKVILNHMSQMLCSIKQSLLSLFAVLTNTDIRICKFKMDMKQKKTEADTKHILNESVP